MPKATDTVECSENTDKGNAGREGSPFRFSRIFSQTARQEPILQVTKPLDVSDNLSAESLYLQIIDCMQGIRDSAKKGERIAIETALSIIKRIVAAPEILSGIHPMMAKVPGDTDQLILQSADTMIYALKIGIQLNYTPKKMTELGLAALLQNVGMLVIPDAIIYKAGKLTEEEITMIKKHPESGRDMLAYLNGDFSSVVEAVYQHHERVNGSGYPQGLTEDAIIEYAQIIGICDSFEAMSRNRPHRKALLQHTSVRQLITAKEKLFSPHIVKAFLEEISLYPVGSYVKLNNGSIGRVIKTNRQQPVRPIIRIMLDGRGSTTTDDEYRDLSKQNVLNIVDVIPEAELPA